MGKGGEGEGGREKTGVAGEDRDGMREGKTEMGEGGEGEGGRRLRAQKHQMS